MDISSEMKRHLQNAPLPVKNLLADLMVESILAADGIPEESKIEVRIMKVCHEIQETVNKAMNDYGCPLPQSDPEGSEAMRNAYPVRREFLEYMQLMKNGLDTFLQQCPPPEIPQKFKDRVARSDWR